MAAGAAVVATRKLRNFASPPMNALSTPEPLESRIAPAVFIVTSLLDNEAPGTLRVELLAADQHAGHDTIIFKVPAPPAHGMNIIALKHGELTSTGDVTITGPGATKLAIDGITSSRVLLIGQPGDTTNDHPSTISGVAILNGLADHFQDGGGIMGYDSLTLTNVIVSGNEAGPDHNEGGGLAVEVAGSFNASVSIINSVFSGNSADENAGGVVLTKVHSATITGSTFQNNGCTYGVGGAIDATLGKGGTSITISNSSFTGNAAESGGALELSALNSSSTGKISISHSTLSGNSATRATSGTEGQGGAIFAVYGNFLITGSTITGNKALDQGGAIYSELSSSVAISGSKIDGNIVANSAVGHGGGGIFFSGSAPTSAAIPLMITGSKISGNHVAGSGSGGGIYAINNVKLAISGSTFSGNYAAAGGAIYATPDSAGHSSLSISASTFTGNKSNDGGGIYASGEQSVTITGGSISGNYSGTGSGGAEFSSDAAVTISGCTITNNVAHNGNAGGVSVFNVPAFNVKGGSISHNFADVKGGGISATGSVSGSIVGCTITGNIAGTGGGINGGATGTLDVQIAKVSGNIGLVQAANIYGNVTYV
jgi:predicted outer membrane repeat protein